MKTFVEAVAPTFADHENGPFNFEGFREAVERFENERDERGCTAVLASWQACLDAHQHERINDQSPLIRREAVIRA